MNKCKHCDSDIPYVNKNSKTKKFCNQSCAAKYNNSKRPPLSDEHRRKISEGLKKRYASNNPPKVLSPEEQSKIVGKSTKLKYKGLEVRSIWECSSRTIGKIIKRMDIGCSRCGWKEASCDLHHIKGRKIDDPHNHTNLILLCPNCHRLAHNKKIDLCGYKTIYDLFGETWKDYYYG
jgi:hypothetical protein